MRTKNVWDFFDARQIKVWLSCGHSEVLTLVQVEGLMTPEKHLGTIRKCERCSAAYKSKAASRKKGIEYACVP